MGVCIGRSHKRDGDKRQTAYSGADNTSLKIRGHEKMHERMFSPDDVRQTLLAQKERMVAKQQTMLRNELNRLPKPTAPSTEYFHDIADIYSRRLSEIRTYRGQGGKVVGQLCVLAPSEIIRAAGAIPVRICSGEAECAQRAQDIVGDAGLCPLAKAIIGGALSESSPYIAECDLVIAPTPCDAKLKAGEVLGDIVPVVPMNTPRVKTDAGRSIWIEEVRRILSVVEENTGKRVTAKSLREAVMTYQNAQSAWRRFTDIRKRGNVIWGRDALLISELTFIDDIVRWTEKLDLLCRELSEMANKKEFVCPEDTPRILLAGSPIVWPNWKVPHLLESAGSIIADDELCTASRILLNPTVPDETTFNSMIEAIADRYMFPCTCPCFTPNKERETNLLRKIEESRIDGVVFHVLKGCHLNSIDATRIKTLLKQKDIPLLILDSDYGDGDVGQLKIRIDAFLEMLRSRKDGYMYE